METTTETIRRPEHLWLLALAAGVVIGSFMVQSSPEGPLRLSIPFVTEDVRIPEVCTSRWVFGVSCPGCGLTRSFAATARGNWHDAFRCNPMGPILFIICLAQVPYRLMEYFGVAASISWWTALKARLDLVTWFIFAGLVGQRGVRLIFGWWGTG